MGRGVSRRGLPRHTAPGGGDAHAHDGWSTVGHALSSRGRPGDLPGLGKNAEREKVIDFTVAYSPFFIAVFGPKTQALKAPAELAGKSIGVTRGSVDDTELTKVAPASAEVRRFEDNTATISAFVAGQTQFIATSAQVAGAMMARNPQLGTEYKFVLKDSPNYIGLAKGEDKLRLRVNEILLEAKKSGDLDRLAVKWLCRPAGDLPQ